MESYMTQFEQASNRHDAHTLATLLSLRLPQAVMLGNAVRSVCKLHGEELVDYVNRVCHRWANQTFGQLGVLHVSCAALVQCQDRMCACQDVAFQQQEAIVKAFLRIYEENESNTLMPIMKVVIVDLRRLAVRAQASLERRKLTTTAGGKQVDRINEAILQLRSAYGKSISARATDATSKKYGTLAAANALLFLFFRTNNISHVSKISDPIDKKNFLPMSDFPAGEVVTYQFFTGRLALYDGVYRVAVERLLSAFNTCHIRSTENKRKILLYLIPAQLSVGVLPTVALMQKYQRQEFVDIVTAIQTGDLALFDSTLHRFEAFFIRHGIYLILERLRPFVYHTLFKRIYKINGSNSRVPLHVFLTGVRLRGATIDIDELACVMANFIYQGYVRGYIHTNGPTLVLGKDQPFLAYGRKAVR